MTLEVTGLTHRYGDERAVSDVSFRLEPGELVGLLGPSGCGKTTLVQAIAGHIHPTAGRVVLRSDDVTEAPPESRAVGLVMQRSTLFPHMTVSENVAYGLAARDIVGAEREARVDEYLGLVDLTGQYDAYPSELSGGQQRRAELARALAPQPDVLLLDEPLSALDRTLRERLRGEIARIQRETGVTTLFVTHDQKDAMAVADRLIVMTDGSIDCVGPPRDLYESPPTPFAASFLGRSNTVSATVIDSRPFTIELGGQPVTVAGTNGEYSKGNRVTCYIRPTDLSLRYDDCGIATWPAAKVTQVTDLGRRYDVTVELASGDELVIEHPADPPAIGDPVPVRLSTKNLTLFS